MDYLKELYSRRGGGMKFGLERTIKFIDYLDNPQKKFKSIHVAGTNGKGSTVNIIAKILEEYGLKVGKFISPHLVDYNERIQINSQKISEQNIQKHLTNWKEYLDTEEITFFEITTGLGLKEFADNSVDVAVIETGLGGRLDSTNIIEADVSVITKIAFDHTGILGDTLEKIANEKAGIIKFKKPVITIEQNEKVLKTFAKKAKKMQTSLKIVKPFKFITNVHFSNKLMKFNIVEYDELFETDLIGYHQIENIALAIKTVELFLKKKLDKNILKKAIRKIKWQGRFETISEKPQIIYDVAHNYSGVKSLVKIIDKIYPNKKIKFVIGILKNKQIEENLDLISEKAKSISIAPINNSRSYTFAELQEILKEKSNISIVKNIKLAIEKELNSSNDDDVICIFGSHYIAEDVYKFQK